ncbi:rCG63281 [Rattus norvegicus]|uniref:RCG63281 n=1 Tax=Rattus norvegicus TaxID=10116 RepID=A6J4C8_RAT|nr:rCG63281 [Rattus norvegicus]
MEKRTGSSGTPLLSSLRQARLTPWKASNWQFRRLGLSFCFQELGKSKPHHLA